jgi:hypothetical protein
VTVPVSGLQPEKQKKLGSTVNKSDRGAPSVRLKLDGKSLCRLALAFELMDAV